MLKVFNWQLGRDMEYPYEESRPDRQFAIAFNINRCIGCQTCTMACKNTWTFSEGQEQMWWNNVETKPYGGYPRHWDIKLLNMLGPGSWDGDKFEGETIFEQAPDGEKVLGHMPSDDDWAYPNMYEDTPAGSLDHGTSLPAHDPWMFYLQRTCNQCTYPGCLGSCPRQAIYKRPEDGIVLVDQERCRGYRKCVEGCPYKKAMYRPNEGVTEKCIGCFPRIEDGIGSRCVVACVGKIRLQGWVNTPENADPNSPLDYLVHIAKVALPLYPQFGTEPNLYYIPPRWAPRPFLKQLFGPGVEHAIEAYTNPDDKLFGLLRLFGVTQQIITRFEVNDEEAIGWNEAGEEIARMPFDEPIFVRDEIDVRFDVQRLNEP